MENVGAIGISLQVDMSGFLSSLDTSFKAGEKEAERAGEQLGSKLSKGMQKEIYKNQRAALNATKEIAKAQNELNRAATVEAKIRYQNALAARDESKIRQKELDNESQKNRQILNEQSKEIKNLVYRNKLQDEVLNNQRIQLAQIKAHQSLATSLLRIIRNIFSFVSRGIKTVLNGFKKVFSSIISLASKAASKIKGFFSNLFSNKNTKIDDFRTKLRQIATSLGIVFSIRGLANFTKEAINAGSELTEVQNIVDTIFPHMAEQVDHFAKTSITAMGLSEQQTKKYVGNLGAMLKSAGFAEEEAFIMSKNLTQLSADVASFRNLENDEVYTKFTSVISGQTKAMMGLGVNLTKTALADYALRKGYTKTFEQMSYNEKIMLRYQKVMEELDYASGDFIKTQKGWANQTRILSNLWLEFKTNIGQGLINILTPLLNLFNQLFQKIVLVSKAFKQFTISVFGDASVFANGAAQVDEAMEDIEDSVEETAKKTKKTIFGFDEINKLTSDDSSANEDLSVQNDLADAYGKQNGLLDEMSAKIDEVAAKIRKWKDDFVEFFKLRLDILDFSDSIQTIKDAWSNIIDWIEDHNIGNSITKSLARIAGDFVGVGASIGQGLISGLEKFLNSNGERILQAWFRIINNIDRISENLTKIFKSEQFANIISNLLNIWATLKTGIIEGITIIIEGIIRLYSKTEVLNAISTVFEALSKVVEYSVTSINGFLQKFFDYLNSEDGKERFAPLREAIGKLVEAISNLWNNVLVPFLDWLNSSDGVQTVAGLIADTLTIICNVLAEIINFIANSLNPDLQENSDKLDAINGLIDTIKTVFSDLWENHLKPALDWLLSPEGVSAVGDIIEIVGEIIGRVIDTASGLILAFIDIWKDLELIVKSFEAIFEGLGEVFSGVITIMKGIFETFIGVVVGLITGDWTMAWDGLNDTMEGVKQVAKGLYDFFAGILGTIIGLVEGIADAFVGVGNAITNVLGIGDKNKTQQSWSKGNVSKQVQEGLFGEDNVSKNFWWNKDEKSTKTSAKEINDALTKNSDGTFASLFSTGETKTTAKTTKSSGSGYFTKVNGKEVEVPSSALSPIYGENSLLSKYSPSNVFSTNTIPTISSINQPEISLAKTSNTEQLTVNKEQNNILSSILDRISRIESEVVKGNEKNTTIIAEIDGTPLYAKLKDQSFNEANRQGSRQYR